MKKIFLAALLVLPLAARAEEDYTELRAAIHISSIISGGRLSPTQVAEIAKENGIDVVVFTERDLMRWEYGQWPFRKAIGKRVEHGSIAVYGAKRFITTIENLRGQFPQMVFIHGAESAPFYYWTGSPYRKNLEMYDWHKHLLTIGLEKPEDYENLPVIGNEKGLRKRFQPFLMWPVLLAALGAWIGTSRWRREAAPAEVRTSPHYRPGPPYGSRRRRRQRTLLSLLHVSKRTVPAAILLAAGIIGLANNWPFYTPIFDQYHGDAGTLPYQNYIDYAAERGGMTFWAHPEADNISELDGIRFETRKHVDDMVKTRGYTGYSVFYTGFKEVGKVGGVWDALLLEHCRGLRKRPVWAICGLACEGYADDMRKRVRLQTALLVKEKSREGVLDALRKGRCYAIRGARSGEFVLEKFIVADESESVVGCAGETVKVSGAPVIYAEGGFQKDGGNVEVKIIRNGRILETHRMESPFRILHNDGSIAPGKCYYRLEIRAPGVILISNPIFVEKEEHGN